MEVGHAPEKRTYPILALLEFLCEVVAPVSARTLCCGRLISGEGASRSSLRPEIVKIAAAGMILHCPVEQLRRRS